MIDIKNFLTNPEKIIKLLNNRGSDFSHLRELIKLDDRRKSLIKLTENTKSKQNKLSKDIGKIKAKKENANKLMDEVIELKTSVEIANKELKDINNMINDILMTTPNVPRGTIPLGKSENDNIEVKKVGKPRTFNFEYKTHWNLMTKLDIVDQDRAINMSGSRFVIYKGLGARLQRALINFMLDRQTAKGYKEIIPPLIVESKALIGSGQLPKFEEDLFKLKDSEKYLIPTAEVPLTYLHSGEIIDFLKLPIKYTAYTPCFRAEAGSAGRDVKGVVRLHQFNKVELFKITNTENAEKEFKKLLSDAEDILKELEIPYRIINLCTGDIGFSASQTYDIELWLPSYNEYKEVSSCSIFDQYQARRANIKYRDGKKKNFVTTINGSGLALERTFAAILENYQNEDGSITIPKALIPYMDGVKTIN